ncbi:MAG: polyprenyl synthetase family protein [Coriobacteriia bacterium]|nr:polyprenyl synthetase family protein [Coriobacteriia bacterium]
MTKTVTQIMQEVGKKPATFEEYLQLYAQPVGDLVNSYIPKGEHPDMETYLYGPLTKYSENGGKRHRPLICFAACAAVGGNMDLAMSAAAAIEHFHTAALIHDDIADDAKTRRGKPCMHLVEGLGLSVNMGDLGLYLVNGTVVNDESLDPMVRLRVISELLDMTCSTIEGQALDIGWARDGRYDITPEDYLCMARHKTAFYSGGVPLAVGAIVGGASEETVEGLRKFGLDTGLAFQIQDDLLNLVGEEESVKKDFRSDITEAKRTLVMVHCLQHSTPENRQRLIDILNAKTEDAALLEEAVQIMQASGSIEYARNYTRTLTEEAKARLVDILPPSEARDVLLSMADYFINRLK